LFIEFVAEVSVHLTGNSENVLNFLPLEGHYHDKSGPNIWGDALDIKYEPQAFSEFFLVSFKTL
jgi:hypothetical protein